MVDRQRALALRQKMAGVRLRALRARQDASVDECAGALGLTPQGLLARELGRKPVLVAEFRRLCAFLGLHPADAYNIGHGRGGKLPGARLLRLQAKSLGAALADGRDSKGWNRPEAASAAGTSEEKLARIELGQEDVGLAQVEALAALYNQSPNALFPQPSDPSPAERATKKPQAPVLNLSMDVLEFLSRSDAERYVRAAMALSHLGGQALSALEDALLFLSGSD